MRKELSHVMLELHNVRITPTNVRKKKTKCDKRIVKCDIGIAQCEDGIVKCDVLVTWYSRLLTSEYCTKKKKRRNTVELSLMYICMCLSVNCPGVSQVVISPHNG